MDGRKLKEIVWNKIKKPDFFAGNSALFQVDGNELQYQTQLLDKNSTFNLKDDVPAHL